MSEERTEALAIAVLWLALVVGMILHFNTTLLLNKRGSV